MEPGHIGRILIVIGIVGFCFILNIYDPKK